MSGLAAGVESGGFLGQVQVGAEAPLTRAWSVNGVVGGLSHPVMGLGRLDGWLSVPRSFELAPTWRARVAPGASIPIGNTGEDGIASMHSSGSFDPILTADVAGGETVVAVASVWTRLPLYAGRDGVQDGVFVRANLLGGVRVGRLVPQAGLSYLNQQADEQGARGYDELSVVAGGTVHLGQRVGLDARVRVPVVGEAPVALVLQGTTVVGKAKNAQAH